MPGQVARGHLRSRTTTPLARVPSGPQFDSDALSLGSLAHVLPAEEVLARLGVDEGVGLTAAEAARRRAICGPNKLEGEARQPFYRIVLEQLDDGLAKLLLAAATVSFVLTLFEEGGLRLHALAEPFAIIVILVLNAFIGAWQTTSAADALDALKRMQPVRASVLRADAGSSGTAGEGGQSSVQEVDAGELVPGDILLISVGEKAPADARVLQLHASTLRVDQAILTGESETVSKSIEPLPPSEAEAELQAKTNLIFAGCDIAYGSATAVVIATGPRTEAGRIGTQVSAAGGVRSPLSIQLDALAALLTRIIGAVCAGIWLLNIPHFDDPAFGGRPLVGALYYGKTAVALAVAAIPEGLPTVVTACLALGTQRMAARNAIARSLPAVETLGATSVICSDKTGTLTTGQMAARAVLTFHAAAAAKAATLRPRRYSVTGTSYDPADGGIALDAVVAGGADAKRVTASGASAGGGGGGGGTRARGVDASDEALRQVAAVSALCNHAHIGVEEAQDEGSARHRRRDAAATAAAAGRRRFVCVGEPTEGALRVLVEKLGVCSVGPSSEPGATQSATETSATAKITATATATATATVTAAARVGGRMVDAGGSDSSLERTSVAWSSSWSPLTFLEFTRERKSMGVVCASAGAGADPKYQLLVKGAPSTLLPRCSHVLTADGSVSELSPAARQAVSAEADALSSGEEALRTLALAVKSLDAPPLAAEMGDANGLERVETDLTLVGLVGLRDPLRPEVTAAVERCKTAGVRVIVITGDSEGTALAICSQAGIVRDGDGVDDTDVVSDADGYADGAHLLPTSTGNPDAGPDPEAPPPPPKARLAVTGRQLTGMGDGEALHAARTCAVFARAEPSHKLRLVSLLQRDGAVVAMTGDGVNDAPALKQADIGVAMGRGADVAKGAADMVLADDNFATIVAAIEEGRAISDNTRAFIRFLLSSNFGEVVAIAGASAIGMPSLLLPLQLLWVNLVTDGLPAIALSFNPPTPRAMSRPPRKPDDGFVDRALLTRSVVGGVYIAAAVIYSFVWWYMSAADGPGVTWWQLTHWQECGKDVAIGSFAGIDCSVFDHPHPRSLALTTFVVAEMLNSLNAISEDASLLAVPPWANRWLLLAVAAGVGQHAFILYQPQLASLFGVAPLSSSEWGLIFALSVPVVVLDELFKCLKYRQTHCLNK